MELGFGATGAWAANWFDEKRAEAVLETALKGGIRHFDTAGFYAGGEADRRLARALERLEARGAVDRGALTISTKIGKKVAKSGGLVRDFGPDTIRDAILRHTELFGGHAPNIVYLHGPDKKERHGALPVLERLKADGALGAIGECSDGLGLLDAADTDGLNVLMGRYHFLNTVNASAFRMGKKNGKTIVSIAPLAQGLWQRRLFAPASIGGLWKLARALVRDRQTLIAAQGSAWVRDVEGWPPAHLALGFVRINEDIDVVLTTSTKPQNLNETIDGFGRDLSPEIRDLLGRQGALTGASRPD